MRAELQANLRRITPMLERELPEALRARVAEARTLGDARSPVLGYLEATREAIALAPAVAARLAELPSELPALPAASSHPINEALLRRALPPQVTDIEVGDVGATAIFRCDGHPFVRCVFGAGGAMATIAIYTSVRRGLPALELGGYVEGVEIVRGSRYALTEPVRHALRAFSRVAAPRLLVADGLAWAGWMGSIDSPKLHACAIAVLVALRAVSSPELVLLA